MYISLQKILRKKKKRLQFLNYKKRKSFRHVYILSDVEGIKNVLNWLTV